MTQMRRPRGIRMADDVHRILRIRAAETDETMEDILDRALRRELGMMQYERYEIDYTILEGNAFTDEGDDDGTYDVEASVGKLADMTADALRTAFPGATVNVTYERNVSGGDGRNLFVTDTGDDHMRYEPGDTGAVGRIADEAHDITSRVWESWDWVVYDDDSSR